VARALRPINDISLKHRIRRRVKEYIVENRLQPGDKLPTEDHLAERLGVSRTAVREAMSSLEALGLVEARRGVGRIVREFNFDAILSNLPYSLAFNSRDVLEAYELRKALDAYFIEPAIENITKEDLVELKGMVDRMRKQIEMGLPVSEIDHAFHALLYARAGSKLATQLFEITWEIKANSYDYPKLKGDYPETVDDHYAILEAIKQRDAARSRELLLASHFRTVERIRLMIDETEQSYAAGQRR
jgi:DNA-binding FadR family transcriptional regulator